MKQLTLGILAHVDAGKTTLSEALLFTAGAIRKAGRVDKKDAFLDNYELERERGITIFSKQAVFSYEDLRITLLDTPGHVDFSTEMERTLQVLEAAVLLISAADGVQSHTRTLWKLLESYQVPVFLFVNKMDQPGADQEKILAGIQNQLSGYCVDFTPLVGAAATESKGAALETDMQEAMEAVAICDEELLNSFLTDGRISQGQLREKIAERKVFPCLFGSALRLQGIEALLSTIEAYAPEKTYPEAFGARVFKVTRDSQGSRLTHMKITGGTLKAKMELTCAEDKTEKVNQIRIYSGERFEAVNEAVAGSVCAVTGLLGTMAGQGLGMEKNLESPFLTPVLSYCLLLPEGTDPMAVMPKLKELEEEDPALSFTWEEELKEIHVHVMGEVQMEILKVLIRERFGLEIAFGKGRIVYKETIADTVEGVGHFEPLRHYAEVHLLLEPGEPGSGLQFEADCSEDILARNWQRLILTHLEEKQHRGVLTGSAITDMKITLVSGRAHQKHTEGGDFRKATYRAVRQGLMEAMSVLLEPYYEFRLEIPEEMTGRAMTDMEKLFADFTLAERAEGRCVLTGCAPVETMPFEEVEYWKELTEIMDWTKTHVHSTLHICWGAQAGLYYHYGIPKYMLPEKMSGIFKHHVLRPKEPLLRGFDDIFCAPHSRHTEVRAADIRKDERLTILAESHEAGVHIVEAMNGRQIFVLGHGEYDADTLKKEYERDLAKGMNPEVPRHYFRNDDPNEDVLVTWKAHANLFYTNWVNYYVYQTTPYYLDKM